MGAAPPSATSANSPKGGASSLALPDPRPTPRHHDPERSSRPPRSLEGPEPTLRALRYGFRVVLRTHRNRPGPRPPVPRPDREEAGHGVRRRRRQHALGGLRLFRRARRLCRHPGDHGGPRGDGAKTRGDPTGDPEGFGGAAPGAPTLPVAGAAPGRGAPSPSGE